MIIVSTARTNQRGRLCAWGLLAIATFLIGTFTANLYAGTFSDDNWVSMGGYPGANGDVRAAVADDSGNIYIGGQFTVVGDVFANSIAKWNGTNWSALGLGINDGYGWVYALAVSGNDLYAAGYITTAGGLAANYIAKWDGTNWSALGPGLNSIVYALAVSGNDLYAGGQFGVAKWNGSSWSSLSGLNDWVFALAVSGNDLYAGGAFSTFTSSAAANYIARWNGTNWSALGSGMNSRVYTLAVSGGDLYAGGDFTTAGGKSAKRIAKWDGSGWSALGSGIGDWIWTLAVAGSDLYASGSTFAGSNYVAKWNGSNWSGLSSGVGGYVPYVSVLTVAHTDLYAVGQFTPVSGTTALNIGKWTGSNWISQSKGLNGDVSALAVSDSGLFAGGYFTTADGSSANFIAKRNGSSWSALGSGMNSNVYALAVSGSDLYAAGAFTMADGSPANRIAKWNGSSWSALGSGMNSNVYALAVSGGDLYAGGNFTAAGGSAANYVAKWNGSSWSPLGSGLGRGSPYFPTVSVLAVLGSDLYAGGSFTNAGGIAANYIARWDGSSWSALGSGMARDDDLYTYVLALAASGSDLYVGGSFTSAGGISANSIAKWNGSTWSPLGLGIQGNYDYTAIVDSLALYGSELYVGGRFPMAGGNWGNDIAKWNGSNWSRLGSGLNGEVSALALSGNYLYAGGAFIRAGGKVSANIVRADLALTSEPPFVDVTTLVAPDLPALASSSVAWADYDNDGRMDFLLTGVTFDGLLVSEIWRNTGNGFTNVTDTVAPGLPQVSGGSVAWADFENDGRLDFLITGYTGYDAGYILVSQLWRNTGNGFENVTPTLAHDLPGVSESSVAWGDYDNDGRLDFIITGFTGYHPLWVPIYVSQVWRNTGSGFTNVTATVAPGLPGVVSGSVTWCDFDNDGRLDFLLTGGIPRRNDQDDYVALSGRSQLWHNTGSGFVNVTDTAAPGLPGVFWSSVAWADYDNDGWQDFVLTGYTGYDSTSKNISQIWRNTGNGFVNVTDTVAPGLPGVNQASVAWGDYDNDGRPDLLLTTLSGSQLWRNTETGFVNVTASVAPGLPPLTDGSVAWGDYDNDGRLDLLLTGAVVGYCDVCEPPPRTSQVWRNNTPQTNPPPAVITGLPSSVSQTSVTLNARINPLGHVSSAWFIWGDSTNYWNATAPQPMGKGISFVNFSEKIRGLSPGVTYYFRAVGSNEQGQVFIGFEQRFTFAAPGVTTSPGAGISVTSATLNGEVSPSNVPAYGWFEWGLTPAFGQKTPIQFLGVQFDSSFKQNLSGLEVGKTYYFRAVTSNSLGLAYGATESFTTATFANVTPDAAPGLPGLFWSSVAWADYDNDGWLDFLLTGVTQAIDGEDVFTAQLWRNTGSGFTNVTDTVAPGLPQIGSSSVALGGYDSVMWGDYDNDGRLDLLTASQVWRNTESGFTNVTDTVAPGLPAVGANYSAWGDYDNDGRLDFLSTGFNDLFQLWRNTGGGFTNAIVTRAPDVQRFWDSSAAWADYDNDGRLDFLIIGVMEHTIQNNNWSWIYVSQLWRNTGSGFTDVTAAAAPGLPGVERGSIAWGDYDNDGRLDFLLTGTTNGNAFGALSQLWRNTGSGFTNVTATVAPGLPGVYGGVIAWGDYDNDGRLDFLLTGNSLEYIPAQQAFVEAPLSQVWRNTGNGFTNVTATVAPGLPQVVGYSSLAWGDYDNDGRLDFLISGYGTSGYSCQIWRNYTPITNTPPSAPTGLAMTASSNAVMLSWNSATDTQTPASGLTYNVRAGTTPGGSDLLAGHVNATNGFRRVPAMGNAMLRHSLPLTGLTHGQTVYWSVQAVDSAFAGGPFATETSVVSLPQLSVSLDRQPSTLIISWTPPTFGWLLQEGPDLSASNWTAVGGDSANPATLPATNRVQFYRLFKP